MSGSSAYYHPRESASALRSPHGASVDSGVHVSAAAAAAESGSGGEASVPAILFAEFLASLFFVFLGGSAVSITGGLEAEARPFERIIAIAIIDGCVFYCLVYMVMKLTRGRSGYFNSALTLSLCLVDLYLDRGHAVSVHVGRALAHIIVQILGALLGAVLIVLLVPFALDGVEKTGVGGPALSGMTWLGAFLLDYMFSAFLVFMLLSVRNNENKKSSMLLLFCMIVTRMILFPLTGSTLNPARAIAHGIIGQGFSYLWIFVIAPVCGAITATAGFIWMHRQDME